MKYLALVYNDERVRDAIPHAEWEAIMRESIAHVDGLAARGVALGGSALVPVRHARTIRDGSVTDGPFAETREQLAGYVFVEAPSLDDAVEAMRPFALARIGAIEVRALWPNDGVIARRVAPE